MLDSTPVDGDIPLGVPAEAVSELARIVFVDAPLESVLEQVAAIAKRAVGGAHEVSVTLLNGQRPTTAAFTGDLALVADELQYALGSGPCTDAARGGEVLLVHDMLTETRWPGYAEAVATKGVRSTLSVPLPVQDDVLGALNVYARRPRAFSGEDAAVAETFASYAAVAVRNAHAYAGAAGLVHQLREAMRSRAVIEQAKGIVMGHRRCTAEEAFDVLVRQSQQVNRKLRDVAAGIVEQATRTPASGEGH
jgi:GAF domain-containing protein